MLRQNLEFCIQYLTLFNCNIFSQSDNKNSNIWRIIYHLWGLNIRIARDYNYKGFQ